MGFLDFLKGKKEDGTKPAEKKAAPAEEAGEEQFGRYPDACAVCNQTGTDKKWMGQFFHKKCYRKLRKMGKGMI